MNDVYNFSELSEEAKERAIGAYINYLLENYLYEELCEHGENFKKAMDKANALQTPWFTSQYIYENCKKDLEMMLEDENQFTKDGNIFN